MTNPVPLDNINHKNLKVITRYAQEFGDNVNQVMVFPAEFGDIQREYPIFFRRDKESGEFQAIALLGLDNDENLFLEGNGAWNAGYIPALCARGPFMIGFKEREADGQTYKEPVIHVNMDDPRVNEDEGHPVFLPQGGNSPYLERIGSILRAISEGMVRGKPMYAAFDEMGLLEPVKLEFKLSDTETRLAKHFYTLNEEKLKQLEGEKLEQLNKAGYLQGAYLVLASQANVNKLISLKNKKRQNG